MPLSDYLGTSGVVYSFKRLIQRRSETGSVWIAQYVVAAKVLTLLNSETYVATITRVGGCQYILKDIPDSYHSNFTEDIWPRLRHGPHPHVRLPCDTVPGQRVLVYKYFSHDFLELARTKIGLKTRSRILKSVLHNLAEMHDHNIVHLDVKPDNIVVDSHDEQCGTPVVDAVQITDFENSAWLQPGKNVLGMLAGNDNWRSPEAHLRAKLNKPTDLFSFRVVCIYAILGRIIFGRDADFDHHESLGIEPGLIRLQRQTSYFGDEAGYHGLRRHFGDDKQLCQLLDAMWEDRSAPYIPHRHFSTWPEVEDDEFKDIVLKLMNIDPENRITAKDALQHPWFAAVEIGQTFVAQYSSTYANGRSQGEAKLSVALEKSIARYLEMLKACYPSRVRCSARRIRSNDAHVNECKLCTHESAPSGPFPDADASVCGRGRRTLPSFGI
nr:serine/threonine-protein kinase ssn3 [Quercus suber]